MTLVGTHDLALITLDTLRYDDAADSSRPGARRTSRAGRHLAAAP